MTYCEKDREKQRGRQDKKDSMNIVWKMKGITHTVCHGGMEYDIFRQASQIPFSPILPRQAS
jgi:hypothetical protein